MVTIGHEEGSNKRQRVSGDGSACFVRKLRLQNYEALKTFQVSSVISKSSLDGSKA